MDETKTPTRDEIPETDKWDLSHLFSSADKWSEDFAWIQSTYPRLTNWKGRVSESARTLAELLEFDKALDLKIERVSHYASLHLAEDSANPDYLARMGQLQNLFTKIGETASFIVPEIQAIDDESFARFLDDPALKEWRTRLQKIRRLKPHVLSEKEERLLALGSSALDGYDDTFSQLTDVDMKFGVLLDEKGEERPLTQSSYGAFLVKRDHGLRKCAFHQFYDEFKDHQFTLAATTHKFEAHYLDSLIGPLPEAAALYRERSPLFAADRLRDPIALFQGEIDQVVPRAQADALVASLKSRGVPHEYHVYAGEGHGWRKAETIVHFYTAVEAFLRQYVLFA
jgi:oligoendopeptidase F